MKTYKFLASGAIGPMSSFHWPEPGAEAPGAWVEEQGPLELCLRGTHVCRAFELAHWLHAELWEVEVSGDRAEGIDCLVVQRARLLRRIDAWHEGGARRFAEACVEHAARVAERAPGGIPAVAREYIEDAAICAKNGYPAVGAHAAALAVARSGPASDEHEAYRLERAWQSDWIAREVIALP
jgi:hypothetical protein